MTKLEFRAYGKWCGPGFPEGGDPEPIDEIDLACKLHDKAHSNSNNWSEADRDFVAKMNGVLSSRIVWSLSSRRPCICTTPEKVELPGAGSAWPAKLISADGMSGRNSTKARSRSVSKFVVTTQ